MPAANHRARVIPRPSGTLTWDPGSQEVKKLPVFGVHDRSLYELHHRLAAVLELGMAPQAEGPFQENRRVSRYRSTGGRKRYLLVGLVC